MAVLVRRSANSPLMPTYSPTSTLNFNTFNSVYGVNGPTLTDMIGMQNQQRMTGSGAGYWDPTGRFNYSPSYTPQYSAGYGSPVSTLNLAGAYAASKTPGAQLSPLAQRALDVAQTSALSSSRRAQASRAAVTGGYAVPQDFKNVGMQPPSYAYNWFQMDSTDPNSPFSNTRYNMLGGMETISRSDPRHTATAYQGRYGDLYNAYVGGAISGSQLFMGAARLSTINDSDEMNTNQWGGWSPTPPPTRRITFNSTGGGGISGYVRW